MGFSVQMFADADAVLEVAKAFLHSRPVEHNLVLTLLQARSEAPAPGRFWTVHDGETVVGLVFQSPLERVATVTPMPTEAVVAVVADIASTGVHLPGVSGSALTAAAFAGAWTECTKSAARPVEGQRIYELGDLQMPTGVPGELRPAAGLDRDTVVSWMREFQAAVGEPDDAEAIVDRRLPAGQFWIWEYGGARSMAAHTTPAAGVSRIHAVYTPEENRRHGYAGGCVAALAQRVRLEGHQCILYTDLANPTSNSVYRRIGFRAAVESLRYDFEPA